MKIQVAFLSQNFFFMNSCQIEMFFQIELI